MAQQRSFNPLTQSVLVDRLGREFPSLEAGIVAAVVDSCERDIDESRNVLHSLSGEAVAPPPQQQQQQPEEPNETERHMRVAQLSSAFDLPNDLVEEILRRNHWDANGPQVVMELSVEAERVREECRRVLAEKADQERHERDRTEAQENVRQLLDMFGDVPPEHLEEVLLQHDGDLMNTIDALLQERDARAPPSAEPSSPLAANVAVEAPKQLEKRERERQEQEERQMAVTTALSLFDLSEEEVTQALESRDWDMRSAAQLMTEMADHKTIARLKTVFENLSEKELVAVLDENDWDFRASFQQLQKQQLAEARDSKRHARDSNSDPKGKGPAAPAPTPKVTDAATAERERQERAAAIAAASPLESFVMINTPPSEKRVLGDAAMLRSMMFINRVEEGRELRQRHRQEALVGELRSRLNGAANSDGGDESGVPDQALDQVVEEGVIVVDPNQPDQYETVTLRWDVAVQSETPHKDWIGLYHAGDPKNNNYVTYYRNTDTAKRTDSDADDGRRKMDFVLPSKATYGSYEFRYIRAGSYVHSARSSPFNVGPLISIVATVNEKDVGVEWQLASGKVTSSAWIGLYKEGEEGEEAKAAKRYERYEYAQGVTMGAVSFPRPSSGRYHFRFFPLNNYLEVARSDTFTVAQ